METTEDKKESFEPAKPEKEHLWLKKLVGEWVIETEPIESSTPVFRGTETVKTIGDLWVVAEGKSEMPDGEIGLTMMTIGYDPSKKRFVGSWVGSMMTYFWVYDGVLDESQNKLSLYADGPSMEGEGKKATYIDAIQFVSDDHRILTSHTQDAQGNWNLFSKTHYRRK